MNLLVLVSLAATNGPAALPVVAHSGHSGLSLHAHSCTASPPQARSELAGRPHSNATSPLTGHRLRRSVQQIDGEAEVWTETQSCQGIRYLDRTDEFPGEPSRGAFLLRYGAMKVSDELQAALTEAESGQRFALGSGSSPLLESDVSFELGDQKLKPGAYRLILQKSRAGWELVLVETREAIEAAWDGSGAPPWMDGEEVPLEAEIQKRKGEPRNGLFFGLQGGRNLLLNIWLGDLHLWETIDPKVRGGRPAAWNADRVLSSLGGAVAGGKPGQRAIATLEYGLLPWAQDLEAALTSLEEGKRWHLARDHWTTLTTNAPLRVGAESIEPGEYSLVLERTDEGWDLLFIESEEPRKKNLNPFLADKVKRVHAHIPMEHSDAEFVDTLEVGFGVRGAETTLFVHWGHHSWTATAGF